MPLMQPAVVGPLSELSRSVRVLGQMPGATVTVRSGTRTVAKGIASSGDQRFPLLPGKSLSSKEKVYAVQDHNGETSAAPTGDVAMTVAPTPSSLGPVTLVSHPYACGQYTWVGGAVPGATVEVEANGAVIGSGPADEGVARLALTDPLPAGSIALARQIAPALPNGPDVGRVIDDIPGHAGQRLPPPTVPEALRGCDQSVLVSSVYDGASVTITRASGAVETAGFDRDTLRFTLGSPLEEKDTITVRQEVSRRCERPPTESPRYTVGPLKPVDAPTIVTPLCAGATVVRVTGLRAGATVHLEANQQVFDGTAPPEQTWLDCHVPPLTTDKVGATQEVCGVTSGPAKPVDVDPHQDDVPAPEVLGPLYSCTGTVSITNAHAGALVQVFARIGAVLAPISDQVLVPHTNAVITVTPLLIEGSNVIVRQWACSAKSVDSAAQVVQKHPAPGRVTLTGPLHAGDTTVGVRGALPGATVEVLAATGQALGSGVADVLHQITIVTLTRPLRAEDVLTAREWICGQQSEVGNRLVVGPAVTFGPRPFWVVGHNPNKVSDASDDANDGATGLEPDLQVYSSNHNVLCINHGTGGKSAPALVSYLKGVHTLAVKNPQLSLFVFDCKEEATSPDHGFELLMAIREHLTFDLDLNIIISVGKLASNHVNHFDRIYDILGPREGLMIDAEDDAGAVTNYFTNRGVANQGYGNGISFMNVIIGPYYRWTLEAACGIRAQVGHPRFIYVWTVNSHEQLREYIRIGVDGAITDDPSDLVDIANEAAFASQIRLATRADNPFTPPNFAYGLHIHTADKWMAGTDANVTFTVTGKNGSASKTVNTDLVNRMESDDWNWVTIPSDDLGPLKSLTVQRDNSGNGPDWYLDRVDIRSARFGTHGTAAFNCEIDSTSPFTKPIK